MPQIFILFCTCAVNVDMAKSQLTVVTWTHRHRITLLGQDQEHGKAAEQRPARQRSRSLPGQFLHQWEEGTSHPVLDFSHGL